MITCYIISESSLIETLKRYVSKFPITELTGFAKPGKIDFDLIAKNSPNIIFVDVALILKHKKSLLKIGQFSTLIYVSAHNHSKISANELFEVLAFDLLIVPFTFERFEMSMNKFIRLSLSAPMPGYKKSETIIDSFFIKLDNKSQKEILIKCNDLIYIEAMQNYVVLNLVDDKKFICHNTMKEMEESLPDSFFIRVHKSFIINYDKVTSVEGNFIVLNDNEKDKVLIGSTYRKAFLERKNQKMIKKKSLYQAFEYARMATVCLLYVGLLSNYVDYQELFLLTLV
jgi:two-component system LytT family response regulator